MVGAVAIAELAATLRASRGLAAKRDIAAVAARLGVSATSAVPVGDDCAAIPDGDGFLLFAIEGFMNEFVAGDPWFAGWCGVMVNVSDVAAMGGRPIAVVDALWAAGETEAEPVLAGMRGASEAFGIPIVGGHTNTRTDRSQLSVAILGRARSLLTSFDARPADRLIAAIDLRGRYRAPFANWEAATGAPPRGFAPILKSCRRLPRPDSPQPAKTSPKAAS
jgi:selenophosphate synthetase-related protein